MASYVVAASFFVLGTSYLIQFVTEPPGSSVTNLDHLELKSRAQEAMEVLLGTPGLPRTWGASAADIDGVDRVGILESGASVRVNGSKFDALARGKYSTASGSNGALDYAEAKAGLGLEGYEFHLRAHPVLSQTNDANYGVDDFDEFRVAYVGDVNGETYDGIAKSEASALENLSIVFLNKTRTSTTSGDVFQDDSTLVRDNLLPNLGATLQQEVISAGASPKYDFYRTSKTSYQNLVTLNASATLSGAMALSSDGVTLGYSKNREIRAIAGSADLSGTSGQGTLASIHWWEWVDTDRGNLSYDCDDYGYVEVSGDGGVNWVKLTDTLADRSQDCTTSPHPAAMVAGVPVVGVDLTGAICPACIGKNSVLVAFHWIADNDNNIGYGWVVDNVRVVVNSGAVALRKTFESPEYDLLVIGSNVEHNAFTPADVKDGIRDYVDKHGGRLLVLGGQSSVQWLDRLFDAAASGSSGGLGSPDITHPLLTLPNQLAYTTYATQTPWDFTASDDASIFSMVTGADATHHYLSVSRQGAWGSGAANEGAVILTSYRPSDFTEDEARRFFANTLVYGRFHYLYLEVGPPVPQSEAVASVSRTAIMNKYRDGTVNYTDVSFVMYLWPGSSVAGTQTQTTVTPLPVRNLAATAGDDRVWVTMDPPQAGVDSAVSYEIWRGNSPTAMSRVANITYASFNGTYFDENANVSNGVTWWYNATVWSTAGRGTPANAVSATPLGLPTAPLTPSATGLAGSIRVDWTAPSSTGGGNIYGYAVWVSAGGAYTLAGEVGNVLTYAYSVGDTNARTFTISALNGAGWSPNSTATASASAATPATAPPLSVSNATANQLVLTWSAPSDLGGGSLAGYRIYRSATGAVDTWYQLAYSNSAVNVTWVDLNLSDNTTYHYRVRAVTNLGDGLNSTDDSEETNGAPWHPTALTQTGGALGSIIMSWTEPQSNGGTPITKYEIFRGASAGSETKIGESLTTAYTDAAAGTPSAWYYKVRAVNLAGEGTFSTSVPMTG